MIRAPVAAAKNTRNVAGRISNKGLRFKAYGARNKTEHPRSPSRSNKYSQTLKCYKKTGIMNNTEYRVRGFKASSVTVGFKKDIGPDMALIFSDSEATAAGVFTTNMIKAAPVLFSMEQIKKGRARAIIVNAGNANACTGDEGLENTRLTAEMAAEKLGIRADEILVASTGVIGSQLDMNRVSKGISDLTEGLSYYGMGGVAEAIMTTDTFPKISRFEGKAQDSPYRIIGIAKGAGMIMPNMATMLAFLLTDVRIELPELKAALSSSVDKTFNRITVDGETSTNDTVLVMANGIAGNRQLKADDYEVFKRGLEQVMDELSLMIVKDGEGATKVVCIKVKGASTGRDAITAARTVANSSLVKTAFYGQDPNWGRIIAALGRSGISMKQEDVSIWVDEVMIVEGGLGVGEDQEKKAAEKMKEKEFSVTIDLNQGGYEDQVKTCDLTPEYISVNADYRT
jgi:glutamate N-acetyltransferase/amino-acid N-acetyltransferase